MFSLGPWSAQIRPGSHVPRPTQDPCPDRRTPFAYGAITLCGWLSQYHSTRYALDNCPTALQNGPAWPYDTDMRNACRLTRTRFRLRPFRSPLLRASLRFLLCPATEMFHFADFASTSVDPWSTPRGFPHSDTPGSVAACASPGHFAACRVLLRCQMPRHPPYALLPLDSLPASCYPLVNMLRETYRQDEKVERAVFRSKWYSSAKTSRLSHQGRAF